ncbi:Outer membrane usher protein SfmD [Pantoea ananatis]|uniref:Outer membrane usher protein SfmD n=2 Tax=Pantoea ananas TaxID=553 RepID=A0AAJ1D226_PANAN|nr:Outer membrane usher protein SfmD [Pantoea ananatis]MCW0339099.1 Outer membrane usher protein SfmD [Pantoea ananatis]MCW0345406.1 Outer membrane usher protein SfmD [Pantoea ananatis]MCW0348319.1 Outer membrane usher protein SfmD [Pantoea ananatis]MCW0355605.1 Outer membrane usher protein SfmD [Pantoea ananatis]
MGRYLFFSLLIIAGKTMAEDYFNPAFLSNDGGEIADLSMFNSADTQPEGTYQTEVYVNSHRLGNKKIKFIRFKKSSSVFFKPNQGAGNLVPCISSELLDELGYLDTEKHNELKDNEECIPIKQLHPDTKINYSFSAMKLNFSIPQASLVSDSEEYISPASWDEGIPAFLVNYIVSGTHGRGGDNYYATFYSALNYGPWRLHNQSNLSMAYSSQNRTTQWVNVSTHAERDIASLGAIFTVGDSSTSGDVFESIGFRGISLFSSDSMLPDNQLGYAPVITGVARTAAHIVIRQNGYVIYQRFVSPGKFAIRDLSSSAASGDLRVTVEEKDGHAETFEVPFSTLPVLKRAGQVKYNFVTGAYRSGNPQQSEPVFIQASLLRGFRRGITLYGGTQLSRQYQSVLLGVGENLGHYGAISADLTHAQSKLADNSSHRGQSLRFLYAKSLSETGTTISLTGYRYSTRNFYSLGDTTYQNVRGYTYDNSSLSGTATPIDYYDLNQSRKGRLEFNLNQTLGDYGSLSLSGGQQTYWKQRGKQTWYQLSYNNSWNKISYSISASHSKTVGQYRADKQISFNFSVPMSFFSDNSSKAIINKSYLTSSVENSNTSGPTFSSGISGSAFKDNSLVYSLQERRTRYGTNRTASLGYTGPSGKIDGTYSSSEVSRDINIQAEGGIVLHSGGITFSQPLGDTNILVSAPGARGIRVDGQHNVETDNSGYAIIPYASEYRRNHVELDMTSAANNTEIMNNISEIVPTKGALVRADFSVKKGARVMFELSIKNRPVPFGTVVTEKKSHTSGLVDDEGNAYLSGLPDSGILTLQWGKDSNSTCRIPFHIPKEKRNKNIVTIKASCS